MRLGDAREPAPEPRLQVTLAQAVLKGDKMDDVVRDAVMIGAAAIRPILTARTETTVAILEKGRRQERWERVAISSAKQCGRAIVPPILEPVTFDAFIAFLLAKWLAGPALMLVEPGATKAAVTFAELDVEPPKAATVLVGPEGGWTPEEIEAAEAACRRVTMGGRDAARRHDGADRDLGNLFPVERVLENSQLPRGQLPTLAGLRFPKSPRGRVRVRLRDRWRERRPRTAAALRQPWPPARSRSFPTHARRPAGRTHRRFAPRPMTR